MTIKFNDDDYKQIHEAFKNAYAAPLDPAWPIQSPEHAIELCMEWDRMHGRERDVSWYVYALTHSHAGEQIDLERVGYDKLYEVSEYTKLVSISWHLAGRFDYDRELIERLSPEHFPGLGAEDLDDRPKLIDFGAAPWVQAIFYYKKGFDVHVVNKSLNSDTHQFGRWLAEKSGVPVADIIEMEPDDIFDLKDGKFDVVYSVDVLEHIPPEADGSPGWVKYADKLYTLTKPGGTMYLNAPLDKAETVRPVEHHVVHFTSPIDLEDWYVGKDFVEKGYFVRRRAPKAVGQKDHKDKPNKP